MRSGALGRADRPPSAEAGEEWPALVTPSPWSALREIRVVADLVAGWLHRPDPGELPWGRDEPVLLLPGFGTSDRAMAGLRRFLGRIGYRARGWGLGRNTGNVPALIPRVVELVEALAEETGRPVRLVGWSLGGNLAREAARERPDRVDRVVTLGTPVVGGPKYTTVAGIYRKRGYDLSDIEAYVDERNAVPIRVPVTAIYSRADGIVSWQACIDRLSPQVESVEVRCSHFGLLVSPAVRRELARCLAPA